MFDCFWERFLGILKNWKFFVFLEFLQVSTLQGALGIFFRKNHLKTFSKLVWTLSGTFLDTFEISNCFRSFFEFFQVSTLQGALVTFFLPKKSTSKNVENVFEHLWERFWSFWKKNESFSIFLKFFQVSTLQGALGTFFLRKNLKTSSKLVRTLLETCLGILNFEKFLHFFEIFRRLYPPGFTGQKISKKSHQNMFGQSWKRFWTFLKIWIHFDFCGTFSSLQGALGRVFFRRNNHAKHDQTKFLGTFLEKFESFEVFPLFCIFCEFRPPRVHWAKNFSEKYLKTSSKLVWKLLRTFLDTFRNSNFFDFFFEFLISRVHWSRKIRKKSPQNKFGHFWKRFSGFWKFNFFSIFLKFFDFSTLQGALHKKFR